MKDISMDKKMNIRVGLFNVLASEAGAELWNLISPNIEKWKKAYSSFVGIAYENVASVKVDGDVIEYSYVNGDIFRRRLENGLYHCETGPATVSKGESTYTLNGAIYSQQKFNQLIDLNKQLQSFKLNFDWGQISTIDKVTELSKQDLTIKYSGRYEFYSNGNLFYSCHDKFEFDHVVSIIKNYPSNYDLIEILDKNACRLHNKTLDTTEYYTDGKLNRTDGPAIVWKGGRKDYYQDGKLLHIIYANGDKEYFIEDNLIQEQEYKNLEIIKTLDVNFDHYDWYKNYKQVTELRIEEVQVDDEYEKYVCGKYLGQFFSHNIETGSNVLFLDNEKGFELYKLLSKFDYVFTYYRPQYYNVLSYEIIGNIIKYTYKNNEVVYRSLLNGLYHREDGPAYSNGHFLNGVSYNKTQYDQKIAVIKESLNYLLNNFAGRDCIKKSQLYSFEFKQFGDKKFLVVEKDKKYDVFDTVDNVILIQNADQDQLYKIILQQLKNNNNFAEYEWYQKPELIESITNNNDLIEIKLKNGHYYCYNDLGQLHHPSQPAMVKDLDKSYWYNGIKHNKEGLELRKSVSWNPNICCDINWKDINSFKIVNDVVQYSYNGASNIIYRKLDTGNFHNEHGPAYLDGYYLDGKYYTKDYFELEIIKRKILSTSLFLNTYSSEIDPKEKLIIFNKDNNYYIYDSDGRKIRDSSSAGSKLIQKIYSFSKKWTLDSIAYEDVESFNINNNDIEIKYSYNKKTVHRRLSDGALHNEHGPAVLYNSGGKEYFLDGKFLTETDWEQKVLISKLNNDPKFAGCHWRNSIKVVKQDGDNIYIEDTKGIKYCYVDNKLHREDGPSIEGPTEKYFYLNDIEYKESEFYQAVDKLHVERLHKTLTHGIWPEISMNNVLKIEKIDSGYILHCKNQKEYRNINGQLDRKDGPAIIDLTNQSDNRYYLESKCYTEQDYKNKLVLLELESRSYYRNRIWWDKPIEKITKDGDYIYVKTKDNNQYYHWKEMDHREDGPSIIYSSGAVRYYLNNKYYEKDKYDQEIKNRKSEKIKQKLNSEIGLTIGASIFCEEIESGFKLTGVITEYRDKDGLLHCEDGPARRGSDFYEYFIHGKQITDPDQIQKIKNIPILEKLKNTPLKHKSWFHCCKKIVEQNGNIYVTDDEDTQYAYEKYQKNEYKLHCETTAAVIYKNGTMSYYLHGNSYTKEDYFAELSRIKLENFHNKIRQEWKHIDWNYVDTISGDGESVIISYISSYLEDIYYYNKYGQRHRLDGPAISSPNDSRYFINGCGYSFAEYLVKIKEEKTSDFNTNLGKILKGHCEIWNEVYFENIKDYQFVPGQILEITYTDGAKEYRNLKGEMHRKDGPAVIDLDGDQEWWFNNELHREDGPAVIWTNGYQEYWWRGTPLTKEEWEKKSENYFIIKELKNDFKWMHLFKSDIPIIDIKRNENRVWIKWGDNLECWYQDGILHRDDGPACKHLGVDAYYLEGKYYPLDIYWSQIRQNKSELSEAGQRILVEQLLQSVQNIIGKDVSSEFGIYILMYLLKDNKMLGQLNSELRVSVLAALQQRLLGSVISAWNEINPELEHVIVEQLQNIVE